MRLDERKHRCLIPCLCGGQLAWAPSCGVVFSGGPCLLDSGGLSSLRAVKRKKAVGSCSWHLEKPEIRQNLLTSVAVELFRGNLEFSSPRSFDRLRNP